tara:strand:+ start:13396 stop:13824 length:429 start_codon:yes stop_codon:yes gene_type:complete
MDINQITLEYLMNPSQYEKYLAKIGLSTQKEELPMNHYQNDILILTQHMLSGAFESNIMKNAFYDYCKACIMHLNTKNTVNTLQKDYENLPTIIEETCEELNDIEHFQSKPSFNEKTLDDFVVKKKKHKKKKIKFPKKRISV